MSEAAPVPATSRRAESVAIDVAIRLGFLGLFAALSLRMVAPFILPLLWAIILTVALYPLFTWLTERLGGRATLAALLITLVGLAVTLGPIMVLLGSLVSSIQTLATTLSEGNLDIPFPPPGLRELPLIGDELHEVWSQAASNLGGLIKEHAQTVRLAGGTVLNSAASLTVSALMFVLSVIVSGFLFKPGPTLAKAAGRFVHRVIGARGDEFVALAGATVRSVSRGVIGVALIQALLIGVGLIVAGVPAAGVLCFIALILAIVQIGPGLVVLPAIIWMWTSADTLEALLFTLYMVPVMLVDNVLKPIFLSRGLPIPMLVILIGVIGGTLAYGLIGLFLGPVILAVFYKLVVAWVQAEDQPDAEAGMLTSDRAGPRLSPDAPDG